MRKIAVSVILIVAMSLSCAVFAESLTNLYDETGMAALAGETMLGSTAGSTYVAGNGTVYDDIEKFETPGYYNTADLLSPGFGASIKYYEYTENGSYRCVAKGLNISATSASEISYTDALGRTSVRPALVADSGYTIDECNLPISLGEYILTVAAGSTAESGYTSIYMPHNFLAYSVGVTGGNVKNVSTSGGASTNLSYAFYWNKDGQEGIIGEVQNYTGSANGSTSTATLSTAYAYNSALFDNYRDGYTIEFRVFDNGTNTVNDVFNATIGFHAVTTIGDDYVFSGKL